MRTVNHCPAGAGATQPSRNALRRNWRAASMALGLVAALGAGTAKAGPLVVNGDFEADTTNGGIVSPPTGWTASGDAGADSAFPFAGLNNGFLGIGQLQQAIQTGVGSAYTLSFELAPDPTTLQDSAATMTVSFGGQVVASIPSTQFSSTAYAPYTYQVVGAAASSTLLFNAFTTNDAGNWFLDSVVLSGNVAQVPEPSSGAIIGMSLALLALAGAAKQRRG